ncbi:MAG: hypothetical protein AABX05_03640, partial [Nanoarchaeota archaeon]
MPLAAAAMLSACTDIKTEPLFGDYSPLTEERKQQLVNEFLALEEEGACIVASGEDSCSDPSKRAVRYEDAMKELFTGQIKYFSEEFSENGYSFPAVWDAQLAIVGPDIIDSKCGTEKSVACTINGTIYMPDDIHALKFFFDLDHELAHVMIPGAKEIGSISNEWYSQFKSASLLKEISS